MPRKKGNDIVELIEKRFYKPVTDLMLMPEKLKELEEQFVRAGYAVGPRKGPMVILKLEDGEVHFVPGKRGIWQYLFKEKEVQNYAAKGL